MTRVHKIELSNIAEGLKERAKQLGFQQCAITLPDLHHEASHLRCWLDKHYQGEMGFLAEHFEKRIDPTLLVEGTQRVVLLRMDYLPADVSLFKTLTNADKGYIARYALGRDYHKLIRKRIKQLGQWLEEQCQTSINFRPFVDSAPILERPLARDAGLGWIGKNTLLLNQTAGSWFFLGSLFTDVELPIDPPETASHCGSCTACLDVCPTNAFPKPYELDARRCISYLTIEYSGSIPLELRPLMGNRIFGCDDCQLVCPWNRFAQHTQEGDFSPRHQLDDIDLIELFQWSEETFLQKTEGSAIRRTGYQGFKRNIAVALGNSKGGDRVIELLEACLASNESALIKEHAQWAVEHLRNRTADANALKIIDFPLAQRLDPQN
ncbi:Epoxyqueuosine reductase [Marinobacterium sp. xm-g-59]|uniref:tRNA epoxyqueuosine(34) reductase QueG n=1 Tax=Marinobacterium sp. xm-g-59 TaxID=2497748 RepID=UPI001568A2E5|nr:tRNA epoxyqueuosine(34) reductase QueG [Marinobacterium sp. xm-g-59]NRP95541.1 Epoxyqueuosine reductase [Marinobacterium sp. xm-g-59]